MIDLDEAFKTAVDCTRGAGPFGGSPIMISSGSPKISQNSLTSLTGLRMATNARSDALTALTNYEFGDPSANNNIHAFLILSHRVRVL